MTASSSEAGSSVAFFWSRHFYPDITRLSGPDIFAQKKNKLVFQFTRHLSRTDKLYSLFCLGEKNDMPVLQFFLFEPTKFSYTIFLFGSDICQGKSYEPAKLDTEEPASGVMAQFAFEKNRHGQQ